MRPEGRREERVRGRAGTELKLTVAGLHPGAFDLDDGIYGHLPRAARDALDRRHGEPVALVVVGDTPRDVEAAHAAGVLAVGVATGAATAGELLAAGAEHVLTDLSDPATLVAIVRAAGEDRRRHPRERVP